MRHSTIFIPREPSANPARRGGNGPVSSRDWRKAPPREAPSLVPSGKGQPSPAPSKRLNVSRTVEAAMVKTKLGR
jgi:hypothetical protein